MENLNELSKQVKTKDNLGKISPEMALNLLKDGNKQFIKNEMIEREHKKHIQETIDGQHPFAIVLSCIDSRVEPSILFDQGIGDLFVARIAGNIVNQDILGSMEYACAVSGSKLVLVLGHTSCGAVKGAIDNVVLDNLSPSLRYIQLAMERVETDENCDHSAKNLKFVDKVAHKNVELSINDVRNQSPILRKLEEEGKIIIAGAIYDHSTGEVQFL